MKDKTTAGQKLGIAGLILGIIGLLFWLFYYYVYVYSVSTLISFTLIGVIFAVIAIILSAVALAKAIKRNGAKGLIIAALVISIIGAVAGSWIIHKKKKIYPELKEAREAAVEAEKAFEDALQEFEEDF